MKYTEVARFGSRAEAETVGHALDQFDIPFMVQSADTGMFGPGMVGWSPAGAALLVPEERLAEVRELLDCVVRDAEAAADELAGEEEADGETATGVDPEPEPAV